MVSSRKSILAVGSQYSWFTFAQEFSLPFSTEDWIYYNNLISALVRPPEWGGGKDTTYSQILKTLQSEQRFKKYLGAGIIRAMWNTHPYLDPQFRLTSPGYLMWERKKKGFLFEFRVRKTPEGNFTLALCDASDFPVKLSNSITSLRKTPSVPSFHVQEKKGFVLDLIQQILTFS